MLQVLLRWNYRHSAFLHHAVWFYTSSALFLCASPLCDGQSWLQQHPSSPLTRGKTVLRMIFELIFVEYGLTCYKIPLPMIRNINFSQSLSNLNIKWSKEQGWLWYWIWRIAVQTIRVVRAAHDNRNYIWYQTSCSYTECLSHLRATTVLFRND